MKSRVFLIYIIISIAFVPNCKAQIIGNNLNIQLGYSYGKFHGKNIVSDGELIGPSFFAHFDKMDGMNLKASYKLNNYIGIGFNIDILSGEDWVSEQYLDFQGSEVSIKSFAPLIQLHTSKVDGTVNRFKLFLEISFPLGQTKSIIDYRLFDFGYWNPDYRPTIKSISPFFGIQSDIGFEMIINRSLGVGITYGVEYDRIQSSLYIDKNIIHSYLSLNVIFRFMNSKRYYY